MAVLREPAFGMNDFHAPKIMKDTDVLVNTILMILFGRPGFYPSLPTLGIFIQQYFHYYKEDLPVDSIKMSLALQCSLLSESINSGEIDVQKTYTEDGRVALLILVPTMEETPNNILVIGVSTSKEGTVIYNYEIMDAAS